jgi:hypothetical protein
LKTKAKSKYLPIVVKLYQDRVRKTHLVLEEKNLNGGLFYRGIPKMPETDTTLS